MSSVNLPIKALGETPLVGEGVTFKSISETVCRVTENRAPRGWWIGLLIAFTISAVLFLFRQKWRTAINRFAEAMTIFAVICALVFPGIHVGRAWYAYYMFPVPNEMSIWPNFKSPLIWDIFAVSTYFTVSLLFWFVGLIPDLATLRDRARNKM